MFIVLFVLIPHLAECQGGPVVEYCNQCKAYLCGPCGSKIHALRLMRIHVRRSLDPSDSLTMDGTEERKNI